MKVHEGPRYQSVRITTATTTAVKSGTGVLRGFILQTTVASTVTFNDATGTKFVLPASFTIGRYLGLDVLFSGKIEVVTAGASALVVIYS